MTKPNNLKLSKLRPLYEWHAHHMRRGGTLFPTYSSLKWFIRQHQNELINAGVLVAVTDILRSDDSSDNAKLKSAEILGKYYSLFDGAFGDEPRRSSDDLLQELEQLLDGAVGQ